jgi:hypothetical protein
MKINRLAVIIKAYDPRLVGEEIFIVEKDDDRDCYRFIWVSEPEIEKGHEIKTSGCKRENFEYTDFIEKLDKVLGDNK